MRIIKTIKVLLGLFSVVFLYILYTKLPNIGNNVIICVSALLIAGIAGSFIRNTFIRIIALIIILTSMIIAAIFF